MPTSLDDAIHPIDAAAVMALLPTRPRLLAIGEPTHGVDTVLELRNEVFRHLVEHEGYRTISLESSCLMGLAVDDYITSAAGTFDDVMEQAFSHGWGKRTGNRDLVRWMREYNDGRPASEMLHFAGFDGPMEMESALSPRDPLTRLHAYLVEWIDPGLMPVGAEALSRLLGEDERWQDPNAMMDPSQSIGQSAEAVNLRIHADDLVSLLDMHVPHLLAVTSRDAVDRARLYGRTAVGLLRYHHAMADASHARMGRLCGLRDSMMAENLLALARRAPTLAHAHNSHLQRQLSSMQLWGGPIEWWSAGALVSSALEEEYAFVPTALGTIRGHGVGVPPSGTVEGLLYSVGRDRFVVDARTLSADFEPRVSAWFGYAPMDPGHVREHDAVLFVRDTQ